MDNFLGGFTAKILPRLAGILAAYLVGKAATYGFTLDPVEMATAMIALYAFVHRAVSKRTNPGDATTTVLIRDDKAVLQSAQPTRDNSGPVNTWAYTKDDGDL